MAVAETAQLLVLLQLKDEMSGAVRKAEAQLGGLNRTAAGTTAATTKASSGFLMVGKSAKAFGGALGHAKTQIGGLLTGPLGVLGLSAGLFSLGGMFGASVKKTEEFGAALEKVQTLTGETALASGALIIQFQKFGLDADRIAQIVGFAEKTLGKLNTTTAASVKVGKSAELQNLELVKAQRQAAGSSTKAIDALIKEQKAKDQITAAQDKTTGSITKLAALDKQYGLQLLDTKGKVVDFSTLLGQLATFYDSNASASTKAYVAAQVLGRGYTQMIPILNEGAAGLRAASAEAASLGLNSSNTVADLAKFHDQMHAFDEQVNLLQLSIGIALLPTLIELSKAATDFVSKNKLGIVGFFKDATQFAKDFAAAAQPIVGFFGQVAGAFNKLPSELKTLLIGGFAVNKASSWLFGTSPLSLLIKGGGLLQRGGTPANPLFVADVTGGIGGVAGAAGAAVGGISVAAIAAVAASVLGSAVIGAAIIATENKIFGITPADVAHANTHGQFGPRTTTQGIATFGQFLGKQRDDIVSGFEQAFRGKIKDDIASATERGAQAGTYAGIIHSNLFGKAAAVRTATGSQYSYQVLEKFLKGDKNVTPMQAFVTGQAVTLQAINKLRTPGNEAADLKGARGELRELKGIQQRFLANGDTKMAAKIGADIRSLEAAVNATTAAVKALKGNMIAVVIHAAQERTDAANTYVAPGSVADIVRRKGTADGGIFTRPEIRLIAERGPEAVVPLSRMPSPTIHLNVTTAINARQNDRGTAQQLRWGSTPARAGAW